jgi:hypothetical protein
VDVQAAATTAKKRVRILIEAHPDVWERLDALIAAEPPAASYRRVKDGRPKHISRAEMLRRLIDRAHKKVKKQDAACAPRETAQ